MQAYEQAQSQQQQPRQQQDIYSYPLPIRIKHPSWSIRKGTYEQILYYLKSVSSANEQILISGNSYTVETLLPYFQNLVQQKHAVVLLKGLQCVEHILVVDKKASSKHCIKTLIDKGIQYFPLLSQQRKAILEKFLDILQLSKIDASFLKNKLNLPHQKSVMYVVEVIAVLNMTSLKNVLLQLSKKHQKKCVRQLAAQIAEQMQQSQSQLDIQTTEQKSKSGKLTILSKSAKPQQQSNCKLTIQKLPHYEQLPSKKQQQYSTELLQKIQFIISDYTVAQLPNFSHILRLMIDDNNHIININAIKCLIAIFQKQKESLCTNKASLVPASFPLLFIFNKFKSHKTHPINSLLLLLIQSILQATTNRVNDLFMAMSEGLSSVGSKANVKFGCALTFFRILALLHQNEDLYACTTNENIENENQNIEEKFNNFGNVKLAKNMQKIIDKIMNNLQKDKKYETEIYLIKYAIGLDANNLPAQFSSKDLIPTNNSRQTQITIVRNKGNENTKPKKIQQQPSQSKKEIPQIKQKKQKQLSSNNLIPLIKTLKQSKSSQKFEEIHLETTLNIIIKSLNQSNQNKQKPTNFNTIKTLLEKSSEQFYLCVRQRRYEMFYLCQLLEHFIENYQPNDTNIEYVSQYLINLLKIISLLKPISNVSSQFKEISMHNVSQLLLVALCKLVINEDIQEVLQNLNQNYGFEILFQILQNLFVLNRNNKIKKKNKKFFLQWLESNTPAMYLNNDYYQLIELINEKEQKVKSKKQIDFNPLKQQPDQYPAESIKRQYTPKSPKSNKKDTIIEPLSSKKKEKFYELENINLSKIENNVSESNDFVEDMQKSSFHQNLQQHLRQIKTHRSYEDETFNDQKNNYEDLSRQYLRNIQVQQFKKKDNKNDDKILNSSPFKQENSQGQQNQQIYGQKDLYNRKQDQHDQQEDQSQYTKKYRNQQQIRQKSEYDKKFKQVQQRRLERQQQRREFMNRMKYEFKPVMSTDNQEENDQGSNEEQNSLTQNYDKNGHKQQQQQQSTQKHHQYMRDPARLNHRQQYSDEQERQQKIIESKVNQRQQLVQNYCQKIVQSPQKVGNYLQPNNPRQICNSPSIKQQPSNISKQQIPDCSFVQSTSSGEFKYRMLNQEKISYMLKTTTNPYPHLRTLVLIPFKSSPKKHQFLKELLHFFNNHVEFKLPQPYTSLALLTILMFSEIKQDKTLIQPLQSLYELVAKQSTTNDFIKTIISLFHTVIEETLPQNRKFLITILLKSMIRMLPFIEDGMSLLRDIQQFYQIGEMVYFQMFEEEYTQIRSYMEEQAIDVVVDKALQQEGQNLRSIVQGWLTTGWKTSVLATIEEFAHDNSHDEQHQGQHKHYQSYI